WTVDTGENLSGPHQGGQSPTQKGKKTPNPDPATKKNKPPKSGGFFVGTRQNKSTSHQPEQ
ncbi:MAG: hypothetical protein RIE06_03990, partial [Roseibium album]|uniref:hypothetical protein n=1 Tax=Roseibium album TaxID=311410 RepID=UPI0032F081FB